MQAALSILFLFLLFLFCLTIYGCILICRTEATLCLSLADATRITGRGFAEAICHWKKLKYVQLGNVRPEYFSQIMEEMGKNCSELEWLVVRADAFRLTKDNAIIIAKNLPRLKNLSFHLCYLYEDGVDYLLANPSEIKKLVFSNVRLIRGQPLLQQQTSTFPTCSATYTFRTSKHKKISHLVWRD